MKTKTQITLADNEQNPFTALKILVSKSYAKKYNDRKCKELRNGMIMAEHGINYEGVKGQ